ncbi:MAG: hypothetical protein K6E75_14085 [Lachnospiraceae bacterium]|nr:hypothetical protein [Lachnospiraceae bacterium]MCR5339677.1 hypothetical protein [Lachnospiraceae bacterium]
MSEDIHISPVKVPTECEKCGTKLEYHGLGSYICPACGNIQLDDFGVISEFLRANQGATIKDIVYETGISREVVEYCLESGELAVANEEDYFLTCHKCGKKISGGRYCKECYASLTGDLKQAFGVTAFSLRKKNPFAENQNNSAGKVRFKR